MILRHYSITETRELLTTLRGVSETLKQLHFDDTTSAIFVDDEPAPVALTNDTSRDRAEVTHMNSDEEINDYRKNSLRPNIYIYIYILCIYIYIYIYIYSDGHRSFFPGSPIPIPILYLLSYAIIFPIPILTSLPDPFPIPIPILRLLPDPDNNIIYIFN